MLAHCCLRASATRHHCSGGDASPIDAALALTLAGKRQATRMPKTRTREAERLDGPGLAEILDLVGTSQAAQDLVGVLAEVAAAATSPKDWRLTA